MTAGRRQNEGIFSMDRSSNGGVTVDSRFNNNKSGHQMESLKNVQIAIQRYRIKSGNPANNGNKQRNIKTAT